MTQSSFPLPRRRRLGWLFRGRSKPTPAPAPGLEGAIGEPGARAAKNGSSAIVRAIVRAIEVAAAIAGVIGLVVVLWPETSSQLQVTARPDLKDSGATITALRI